MKKIIILFLLIIASALVADVTMIGTDNEYSYHKRNGKSIFITRSTTTIYEKSSGKPGVYKKIITEVKKVNDRKNKKSSTKTIVTKTVKPVKRKRQTVRKRKNSK